MKIQYLVALLASSMLTLGAFALPSALAPDDSTSFSEIQYEYV